MTVKFMSDSGYRSNDTFLQDSAAANKANQSSFFSVTIDFHFKPKLPPSKAINHCLVLLLSDSMSARVEFRFRLMIGEPSPVTFTFTAPLKICLNANGREGSRGSALKRFDADIISAAHASFLRVSLPELSENSFS